MALNSIPDTALARSEFLPFSPPAIGEEEIEAVAAAMRSGWITTGPRTKEFEREIARYLGVPEALAVNSCTAALHTALVTLGIGPGDEVITTPMTFAASVNVIEHVGARPILVDVEPDTLNIDPAAIARAVTPRTKAILPVHYAGHPVDIEAIEQIAREHGLAIIEDAAHAIAARYATGELVGARGHPTAFSFYATKNLATGEGGVLAAKPELLERARVIALHGMSKDAFRRYEKGGTWAYEILMPGFKYNMTDVQAAMGLVQLRKLEAMQRRRRELAERYNRSLAQGAFDLPSQRSGVTHAWHLFPLRLRLDALRIDRNEFSRELARRNIGHSVHFIPVHVHPYYRDKYGFRPMDLPVAYEAYTRLISLPLHPGLSDADADDVVQIVLDIAESHAR